MTVTAEWNVLMNTIYLSHRSQVDERTVSENTWYHNFTIVFHFNNIYFVFSCIIFFNPEVIGKRNIIYKKNVFIYFCTYYWRKPSFNATSWHVIDNNTNNKRDKDMLHNQTVFNLDYIKRGRYKKSLYQNNKRSHGLS